MNECRIAACLLCVQILYAAVAAAQDARAQRPWQASISVGGGWNDNPALIGSAITFGTPTSAVPFITRRGAYFGRFAFDGSYDLIRGREQLLTVGYGLHGDQYENDAKEVNQQAHNLWAGYQRRLAPNFAVSFQAADEYVRIGGSGFSNAVTLEPSAYWRFASWGALELNYKRGYFDMRIPVLAPGTNRDGTFDEFGGRFFFDVPALKRTRRQRASLPVVVPSGSCHRTPRRAARRLALRYAARNALWNWSCYSCNRPEADTRPKEEIASIPSLT